MYTCRSQEAVDTVLTIFCRLLYGWGRDPFIFEGIHITKEVVVCDTA